MRYRFTKESIGIRKNREGSWVLSIMLNGYIVERAYMYYTKAEAIKKFQNEFGLFIKGKDKPIAVMPMCNHGGMAIMQFEYGIDFYVYVVDDYGDKYTNQGRYKLYDKNDEKGNFFIRYGKKYYIKDFIKADF